MHASKAAITNEDWCLTDRSVRVQVSFGRTSQAVGGFCLTS